MGCKCKECKCGSATPKANRTISAKTTASKTGDRASLYKVIMSCMSELHERDNFYQFPMSYSYQ